MDNFESQDFDAMVRLIANVSPTFPACVHHHPPIKQAMTASYDFDDSSVPMLSPV